MPLLRQARPSTTRRCAGASHDAAKAIDLVGVDGWPRFLAQAQARASDPMTVATTEKSQQRMDLARNDAIRPVYPIETMIGIGAAGLAGGFGAAVRAGVGAVVRQVLPEGKPSSTEPPPIPGAAKADVTHVAKKAGNADQAEGANARPILLSRSRFGHTFEIHGEDATAFLTNRADAMEQPNGQLLDNQAAARFIQENLSKAGGGPVSFPIPESVPARIINPDGSFSPARTIRLVPGGKGVKTAFPGP